MFTLYCEAIKIESSNSNVPTVEFGLFTSRKYFTLGNNNFRVKTGCFYTFGTDIFFDSKWRAARAFGAMALIIGGLAAIATIFGALSNRFNESSWQTLAGIYMVILPLFQGLTFLMLHSRMCSGEARLFSFMDEFYGECQWNSGSTANVFGIVLWFATGAFMLVSGLPIPESPTMEVPASKSPSTAVPTAKSPTTESPATELPTPTNPQQFTYQRTENLDGTVTVTQTYVEKV